MNFSEEYIQDTNITYEIKWNTTTMAQYIFGQTFCFTILFGINFVEFQKLFTYDVTSSSKMVEKLIYETSRYYMDNHIATLVVSKFLSNVVFCAINSKDVSCCNVA